MLEIVKPGLETAIQELPGRLGFWEQGFPPSGPMDGWSFRLANLLVANPRDTAALECQFLGPTLRFHRAAHVAVTGGDMAPTLDGAPLAPWRSHAVAAGQELSLGAARTGARTYVAVSGGIDTPAILGSRATFTMAGVGGFALKAGQTLPVGETAAAPPPAEVAEGARPPIALPEARLIECMLGPNDDWLDEAAIERFFAAEWRVQAKSSRTGIRFTGPAFTFAEKATRKRPEHGQDPSNILDHGYPLGAINLAGQTPIALVHDSPSTGGFINPFTVPSAALWKLGQVRPNETVRFRQVDLDEANALRRTLDHLCTAESLLHG